MTSLPYGTWPSPITPDIATRSGVRFADRIAADGETLYWVESRPEEGGRSALVRRHPDGSVEDVGPSDFDTRTRVHEYGGGAFGVADGTVFAASFTDQRWYRIASGAAPVPITPEPPTPAGLRYADPAFGTGWAIVVRETHHDDGSEPSNDLARIDLTGAAAPVQVATGHDFFAAPRISPDGTTLAWLTWDHPRMPWEGTDLWIAALSPDGSVGDPTHIAGGPDESVLQPEWSPDGVLHFASDRTGWWNLCRRDGSDTTAVHPDSAEYAWEPWNFGGRRYAFLADGRLVAAVEDAESDRLLVIGSETGEVPIADMAIGGSLAVSGTDVAFVASSPDRAARLITVDLSDGRVTEVHASPEPDFDAAFASIPETITFSTPDGPAHALFYPPTHPEATGPENEHPPLIVTIHGGPTSRITSAMSAERLFWTSRGFGVVDVDYGGSTGYGRAYRERLNGEWGVVDVRDCALAAAHLAETGQADPERMAIAGGSAGGYTVLMALAMHDVFAGGIARYPVTDLEALATDTHKFESRYLDSLVGPLPETRARYTDRSPLTHVDRITAPVLLLQGSEDRVVPPSQPKAIRDALQRRGVPVTYIEFTGEGHGFRSGAARIAALEAEYSFLGEAFGMTAPD